MIYVITYETKEKVSWFHQGISAISMPLVLKGDWNILAIDTITKKIRPLMPVLIRFFKRCQVWAKAMKWSRGLRNIRRRELGLGTQGHQGHQGPVGAHGSLPSPNRSPQWRRYLEERALFFDAREVEGTMFLHGRLQRPSRIIQNLPAISQTTQDPVEE